MSFNSTIIKIMIASPSDVKDEREIIRGLIYEWNAIHAEKEGVVLLPVSWETHSSPEMGAPAQEIINRQILDDCDLLVGVFWTRFGTPTEQYDSGTVEEIEEHVEKGKPAMLYFSSVEIAPNSIDPKQYDNLLKFREECKKRGLFETYSKIEEFKDKFNRQLQHTISRNEYLKNIIQSQPVEGLQGSDNQELSKEARILLKEGSLDPSGYIRRIDFMGGSAIQTNHKNFVKDDSPRTRAIWEGALHELDNLNLISTTNGNTYKITREGYEVAEKIIL